MKFYYLFNFSGYISNQNRIIRKIMLWQYPLWQHQKFIQNEVKINDDIKNSDYGVGAGGN